MDANLVSGAGYRDYSAGWSGVGLWELLTKPRRGSGSTPERIGNLQGQEAQNGQEDPRDSRAGGASVSLLQLHYARGGRAMKAAKKPKKNKLDSKFRAMMVGSSIGRKVYRGYAYERVAEGHYRLYDLGGWVLTEVFGTQGEVKELIKTLLPKGAIEYWRQYGGTMAAKR